MRRRDLDRLLRGKLKPKKQSRPRPQGPSPLEEEFFGRWQHLGGQELRREYRFHDVRRWKFDFAHPQSMVAIEIEGGIFMRRGRHNTATGFIADCEKYNTATMSGWHVIRLTKPHLTEEWIRAIQRHIEDRLQAQNVSAAPRR